MSKYYRDLHDRELLSQAESVLTELHRRRLLDVQAGAVRCQVNSVVRNGSVLSIVVKEDKAKAGSNGE